MRLFSYLVFMIFSIAGMNAYAGVADTLHNLSVSGPGTVKAATETEICIFCHTPHNASADAPLWNRQNPGSVYIPYSSTTAIAQPGQPTGASILCLSCHDGTIALGEVLSRDTPITMAGGVTTMPNGATNLGVVLTDDHPISFNYTSTLASQNGELADPATLTGLVRLDANGQMQCTSCHTPHDNTNGKFLVMNPVGSALCTTCHTKDGWLQTPHSYSAATWNNQLPDPWPTTDWLTVADNGCENCHQPHSAGSSSRLLKHAAEESNCESCHNGNVAAKDIMSVVNQFSGHPLAMSDTAHDPTEANVVVDRHVECVDCHNPHKARPGTGANATTGVLNGVPGVDINGANVDQITETYQLCFRCHGDSTNKPPAPTPRVISQTNTRLEYSLTNPSYHPVAGPGRNPNVPSLIAPMTTSSTISCTDCHNSNTGTTAGGTGAEGPHGSAYDNILIRRYETADYTPESASNYALCYGCHDRNSILGDESFTFHYLHVVQQQAPCNACHDPHGVSDTQGTTINNTHLINFDTSIVSPNNRGELEFEDRGTFAGNCRLSCHGRNHGNFHYPHGGGNGSGNGGW